MCRKAEFRTWPKPCSTGQCYKLLMPKYLIRFCDGQSALDQDKYETELSDLVAAKRQATKLVGEMLQSYPDRFWDTRAWTVDVMDQAGRVLFTVLALASVSPAAHPARDSKGN
jgi:hypothetical protein